MPAAGPLLAVLVIAHRGNHVQQPENSLAAYQAAIEAGCDYIEVDVWTTREGKLVVTHDRPVEPVAEGRFPTFDEALKLARGKIGVYVDAKSISAADLVAALERHGAMDRAVIYGRWELLKEVALMRPRARIMPEARDAKTLERMLAEGKPPVIAFDERDFTDELIAMAKRAGAKVYVDRLGAADNPAGWEDAIRRGADAIQTDMPEELLAFLRKRATRNGAR